MSVTKASGVSSTFRQSMTWVHTWFGLTFCWIMYFMFVTGTLGYFDTEIDQWMQPELPVRHDVSLADNIAIGEQYLRSNVQGAESWYITPVQDRHPYLSVFWTWPKPEPGEERRKNGFVQLDAKTGEVLDTELRATGGGQTLYRMHYLLHYIDGEIAYKLIGIITLLMFIGVMTGIVIHRAIFVDLFTFRPDKKGRAWLDLHNVASVTSLPFQLMISYSGLIFMVTTFFPLIAIGSFGFDANSAREELPKLFGESEEVRAEQSAPLTSLHQLVDTLSLTANDIASVGVHFPGAANAHVDISLHGSVNHRIGEQLTYDGVSGEFIGSEKRINYQSILFSGTMLGLHEGLFAGPFLRWLYFIAGVFGCVMMATGAIYWVQKRQQRIKKAGYPNVGLTLVTNLNIGTITGLLSAVGAYFWANRLLPLGLDDRANWEVHVMFLTWAVCLIHPFVRRHKRQAWIEQCGGVALVYLLLPVVNALTTNAHLGRSLPSGNWVLAGVDLLSLVTGGLAVAAIVVLRRRANASAQARWSSTPSLDTHSTSAESQSS